jgi:hypothetical protein
MKDTCFEIVEWDHSRAIVLVLDVKYEKLEGFDDLTHPDNKKHIVTMLYADGVTHEVTLANFRGPLMARPVTWSRWKELTAPKITAARQARLGDSHSPMAVYATVEGAEKLLFQYFTDEISFSPWEFVGRTVDQAYEIRRERDVAYLRS